MCATGPRGEHQSSKNQPHRKAVRTVTYAWSQEQIDRYFGYYELINTRNSYTYLNFATTHEFAREVLPPCLEPTDSPTITVGFMSFFEAINGVANRPGRDRAGIISIDARHGDQHGEFVLTAIETEEMNIETGRELWGMPKKMGTIDSFDDGSQFFGFVERKGHRLIEVEATMEDDETGAGEIETSVYFELRGFFEPNSSVMSRAQLMKLETKSAQNRFRSLSAPKVTLTGSPFDPGVGTVPLGEYTGGGMFAGESSYQLLDVVNLENDGNDYRPYVLGRMYDDWADLRVPGRERAGLRLNPLKV